MYRTAHRFTNHTTAVAHGCVASTSLHIAQENLELLAQQRAAAKAVKLRIGVRSFSWEKDQ